MSRYKLKTLITEHLADYRQDTPNIGGGELPDGVYIFTKQDIVKYGYYMESGTYANCHRAIVSHPDFPPNTTISFYCTPAYGSINSEYSASINMDYYSFDLLINTNDLGGAELPLADIPDDMCVVVQKKKSIT